MDYEKNRDDNEYFASSNWHVKEHFHRSIEFLYEVSGDKKVVVSGKPLTLNEGQLLIVPPLVSHEYFLGGEGYCNVLPTEYSETWEKYVGNKLPSTFIISDEALAKELYFHLKKISSATNRVLKAGIYNYVLGRVFEKVKFSETSENKSSDFTVAVLKYIDEHFNEEISLKGLSSVFGYSTYYFSKLFNACFNCNLKTYLNKARINKATTLLNKYTISEVSGMCGYNSLQAFFLNFKKVTGLTPKEYLKISTD